MPIWDDVKAHPAMAGIFLLTGFVAGLSAYKYVPVLNDAETVIKGSYILKVDIDKTHVSQERYKTLETDLSSAKTEVEALTKRSQDLSKQVSEMSSSVCQRYALDVSSLTGEQQRAETTIQAVLSPYTFAGVKDQAQLLADDQRAKQLSRYSEQLNQQIIQIRGELAKCGR